MIVAPPQDAAVGMEVFLSDAPGTGGKLKSRPEDFLVTEIPLLPPRDDSGTHAVATIRSTNWETNRLVREMGRALRISRKRITFAGTKDKRAVTTQVFGFAAPVADVLALKMPDVEVLDTYPSASVVQVGALIGNRFEIVLRGLRLPRQRCDEIFMENEKLFTGLGGFPNFFGVQRFGAVRPNTHLIGRHIINGDFRAAVMLYAGSPSPNEDEAVQMARAEFDRTEDARRALLDYPKNLSFEKAILNRLADEPGNYIGALRALPENLLQMFIHAYQSYLFNRILSERIRRGMPLSLPVAGDIAFPILATGLPDSDHPLPVTAGNEGKIQEKARSGKVAATGLVFGSRSEFSQGEMGEIERKVVDEEKLQGRDFVIPQMRDLTSKGTRRELLARMMDFRWELGTDATAKFSFRLNRGCYATSLLREYMKGGLLDY